MQNKEHPSLAQSAYLSYVAHKGQVDKAGNPYYLHPQSVVARLPADATEDELHAAYLHDVLEDTRITLKDLKDLGYNDNIIAMVVLLTRPPGVTYMNWIRGIAESGNRGAIRVKLADNYDNSSPERIAQLPVEEQDIKRRYERSIRILERALHDQMA